MSKTFRLGLLVNPFAGIGGPAGLKGSDDPRIQARALRGELPMAAGARARIFWQTLIPQIPKDLATTVVTVPGPMGSEAVQSVMEPAHGNSLQIELADYQPDYPSSAEDTRAAARAIVACQVDLLIFVGGDGTARDLCAELGESQPVLGVPAGVKMHSAVYAINPQSAAQVVAQLMAGQWINLLAREVRDIDEQAFQRGVVKSQHYGYMVVPEADNLVQQVKQGGRTPEELVLMDIADHLQERLQPHTLVIMGPGSTTWHISQRWGIETTLLGVDVICDEQLVGSDIGAAELLEMVSGHSGPVVLVITAIGGQGHILGRGNQQISAQLLRLLGRSALQVVATRSKLATLEGRPLVMDTGDVTLDQDWQGYIPVICGYHDVLLYPLGKTL